MLLSKEDRTKLEVMRRQTRDKKEHVRLPVLIMPDSGYRQEGIAESERIDSGTASNYKNKHEKQGRQAYLKDNYVSDQGLLSPEQLQPLNTHVQAGVLATAGEIGAWIAQQWQINYWEGAVGTTLSKLDFVHKKVKLMPRKADEHKQETFVEELNRVPADLPSVPVVYFGDATHPTHHTQPGKACIKKGAGEYIPAHSAEERVNLNEVVNANEPADVVADDADQGPEAETVTARHTITLNDFKAAILNFFIPIDRYEFEFKQFLALKFQILRLLSINLL